MSATSSNLVATNYKDRSAGLVIFGVLTILLGALCALLVPLMLLSPTIAPAANPGGFQAVIPAALMYLALAVILVWLGVGSITARRWARALLVILFWGWLLAGVIALIATALLMPTILAAIRTTPGGQSMPPGAAQMMMLMPLLMVGVIMVVVPGVGLCFYSSSHVRATCEARDPIRRWTDACPLPLLAVVIWVALMVPTMLLAPLTGQGVLPFFGWILTGWRAALGFVIVAGLWAWSARAMYRLDVRGWWILVASLLLFTLSNIIVYSRHDLMEIFQRMNYPQEQMEVLLQIPFFQSRTIAWVMGLLMIPVLAYLIYVKKFFPRSS